MALDDGSTGSSKDQHLRQFEDTGYLLVKEQDFQEPVSDLRKVGHKFQ